MHTQSRPVAARRDLHMCYQTMLLRHRADRPRGHFAPCFSSGVAPAPFSPPTTFTLSSSLFWLCPGIFLDLAQADFSCGTAPTSAGVSQSHKGHRDSPVPPAPTRVREKPEPEVSVLTSLVLAPRETSREGEQHIQQEGNNLGYATT